mgnify:CR=1 FL=1
MAHFAEIDEKGIVKRVIVAEQDFIDSGKVGDPKNWIQTSYDTHNGVHLLGGTPLRKNYAGIGYTYDKVRDAFIPPPQKNWNLNDFEISNETGCWEPKDKTLWPNWELNNKP